MTAEPFVFCDEEVRAGERRAFLVPVSESYSGLPVSIPAQVWRGEGKGPTVFITAAVHGDEVNGAGAIRSLITHPPFELVAGTLILVPVVNLLGFERHSRYLPDRRDLNRRFPGQAEGSLASRFAEALFRQVVLVSDYGIDLHTGAVRRTNFPNVRGNLRDARVRRLAEAFGCELVISSDGPQGSLRRAACEAGRPTIVLEAGEVWKVEPSYVEVARSGVRNVLIDLAMVEGERRAPLYQVIVSRTRWLRANDGGMLQFHVAPGELVEADQPLVTITSLLGNELGAVRAPLDAVILGMTTMPFVAPGDPVCHLAFPGRGIAAIRRALEAASDERLAHRLRSDLATSLAVEEANHEEAPSDVGSE